MSALGLVYDHDFLVPRGFGLAPESALVAVVRHDVETFAYADILPPLLEASS